MNSDGSWTSLREPFEVLGRLAESEVLTLIEIDQIFEDKVFFVGRIVLLRGSNGTHVLPLDLRQKHRRSLSDKDWFNQLAAGKRVGGLKAELDPHWYGFMKDYGLNFESFLLFPVFVDQQLWGIMGMGGAEADKRWSDAQKMAVDTFATVLANQLIRRAAQQALTASMEELALSENRYRNFVNLSMEGIYYLQIDPPMPLGLPVEEQLRWYYHKAYLQYCNPTFCAMYGLGAPEEVIGMPSHHVYAHDPNGDVVRAIVAFVQGGYRLTAFETREITQNNTDVWYINSAVGVVEGDRLIGVWGIQQDITTRKRAELALVESELKLKEVMAGAQIGIWEWRRAEPGHFDIDENVANIMGLPPEQRTLASTDFWQRLSPESGRMLKNLISRRRKDENRFYESDFQLLTASGKWRWVHLRGVVVAQKDGQVERIIGTLLEEDERKNAEKLRLENESLFRAFFDYSPLGVYYIGRQLEFLYVNRRFCEIIGYEPEELLGRNVWSVAYIDDHTLIKLAVEEAFFGGQQEVKLVKRYLHRNGDIVWVNVTVTMVRDDNEAFQFAIVLVEDITEQMRYKEAVEINEARVKLAFNALPDLKFLVTASGFVIDLFASAAELDTMGLRRDLVVEHYLADWMPSFITQGFLHNIRKAQENPGEVQRFEFIWPAAAGALFYEARISSIDAKEIIIVLRNLTAWKRAERDLQEKIHELDVQNRKLEAYIDSNLELENFAYIASHDLREPIRTLRTYAQILDRRYTKELDESGRIYLNFISQAAIQMNNLIEDLLTYSRVNTEETRMETIDLRLLLKEIEGMISNYIVEKNARIEYAQLPEVIRGSYTKLQQLFMNLIVNAIKFGPVGEGADPPLVTISCLNKGGFWEFSIRDNGIGIAPDFHEQIFLLFKKLHPSQEYRGTGIGLALCKKIVEQHGGSITVLSAQGRGSEFIFTLNKDIAD